MKKKQLAAWIVLGIITVVAGFALAASNEITKGPIDLQYIEAEEKAKQKVLASADSFEPVELGEEVKFKLFAGKKGDQVEGYVGMITVIGFAGPVDLTVGIKDNGELTGLSVGGKDFAETAGLGAKSKDAKFTDQFIGKIAPIKVMKGDANGNASAIDAITAATITSSAVTSGVNKIAKQLEVFLKPAADTATQAAGEAITVVKDGFAGPVAVTVKFGPDGAIAEMKVGDKDFNETEGFGASALEENFAKSFIGKKAPIKAADIDAISGATITTTAVIDAVNEAATKAASSGSSQKSDSGEAITVVKDGFAGPVAVTVKFGPDGAIAEMKVGDKDFNETEGFGASALEENFAKSFIGKKAPIKAADIDAISGATITTTAVIDAVNEAATKAASSVSSQKSDSGEAITVVKDGFAGPVAVTVKFGPDGAIAEMKVGDKDFNETEGFGASALEENFAKSFIGKKAPIKATDIDAISGATITTTAVIDAVNEAFQKTEKH